MLAKKIVSWDGQLVTEVSAQKSRNSKVSICTLFWGTLQGTASTTPPINGNAKGVVSEWCPRTFCPILSRSHFGPIMPTTLGNTKEQTDVPMTLGKTKEQTDAARRRARQSIREYELIWLLQQRLRAVSWPHWRLRCMQPLHGHGMGVVRP